DAPPQRGGYLMKGNATQVNVVVGLIRRSQGDFAVDPGESASKFGKPGTAGSKIMGHGLYLTLLKGVLRPRCIRRLWPRARVQYGIEVFTGIHEKEPSCRSNPWAKLQPLQPSRGWR